MAPAPKAAAPVAIEASPPPTSVEDTVKTVNSNPGPTIATSPTTGTTNPATNRKDLAGSTVPQSIQLPSSDADYLNNPPPIYPRISRQLGEHGKTVIRVLIGKDGSALQAVVHKSSGFERLDQAAWRDAMSWRYAPGQRAGIAQDMWFDIPFTYGFQ